MSGLAVNASISEEPALLCFGNAWEESPMELDSWRLVSSIPRDWSNSGFPAAFLFERTQIVFWTFFHSWRNEEPYHLPPPIRCRRSIPLRNIKTADRQYLQASCDWADRMRRVQLLLPLTCQVKPDVSFAFCIFWRSILALHDFGSHIVAFEKNAVVLRGGCRYACSC